MAQILWEPTNALNPPADSWEPTSNNSSQSIPQHLQYPSLKPLVQQLQPSNGTIPRKVAVMHTIPGWRDGIGFRSHPGVHLDVSSESTGVVSSPWLDLPDFCDHLEENRWRTIINARFFHFSLAILEPGRPSLPRTNPAAYPLPFQAQKFPCGGAARFSS